MIRYIYIYILYDTIYIQIQKFAPYISSFVQSRYVQNWIHIDIPSSTEADTIIVNSVIKFLETPLSSLLPYWMSENSEKENISPSTIETTSTTEYSLIYGNKSNSKSKFT